MTDITRRNLLKCGALGGASLIGSGLMNPAFAQQKDLSFKPEPGASLRVLRWKEFVAGDNTQFQENAKKFTERTGVPVRIDREPWEDVRPKSAVAANVGSGPDIVINVFEDPHQYPDKLVDLTDLAEYLGNKYGGWYPVARTYGTRDGKWIGLPLGVAGAPLNYRISSIRKAGFDKVPTDLANFLKLCQNLKKNGTPAGFALGHAIGDANCWCYWLLWAHGATVVDKNDNVTLNSPVTIAALEYGKQLYDTMIPGTASWLDPSNNKVYLDGQLHLTNNGVSIYYAAKNSPDPKLREIAEDTDHAPFPIGVSGEPTEYPLFSQAWIFNYSKYPNAAKEFLRFMWEKDQYETWQQASLGYITQTLKAYEDNPIWTSDPKLAVFKGATARMRYASYPGSLGYASSAVLAEWVVVDMVADATVGGRTAKEAAQRAQARAERIYRG
jgi:multiple sugar transport system substrate-binding protein